MPKLLNTDQVQEFDFTGDDVPERYKIKGDTPNDDGMDDICSPVKVLDVPVIDLALLTQTSPAGEEERRKLRSALGFAGCFLLTNHGMTDSYLDNVFEIGHKFFNLPREKKLKHSRKTYVSDGYGSESIYPNQHSLDWMDRLYLTVKPQNKRILSAWPQNPPSFRDDLDDYIEKLGVLNANLLKAMAKTVNLKEDRFLKQYGDFEESSVVVRYNYYPPCPRPDLTLGVKPHADATTMTILILDQKVEGLQIFLDGQWFKVPKSPHRLFIQAGDQLEMMSNGLFKSTVHRVVTNPKIPRLSLAIFFMPNGEQEIGPVDELVSQERPKLYKTVKDYVGIHFGSYQTGKRPIESVKI